MFLKMLCAASAILFTVSACRGGGSSAPSAPGSGGDGDRSGQLCDLASLGADACNGKRVQIKARASEHIHQHPLLSRELQQSYWDMDQMQMIFLSAEALNCRNRITAIGVLRARVGPCDPNAQNKNQYCGMALEVQTYECR